MCGANNTECGNTFTQYLDDSTAEQYRLSAYAWTLKSQLSWNHTFLVPNSVMFDWHVTVCSLKSKHRAGQYPTVRGATALLQFAKPAYLPVLISRARVLTARAYTGIYWLSNGSVYFIAGRARGIVGCWLVQQNTHFSWTDLTAIVNDYWLFWILLL
jgi:hypothetical protein